MVTVPIAGSWDVSPRGYSAFCTFCSKCADVFSSVATFCFILFLHFHRIMSSSFIPLLISRLLIRLLRLCSAVSVLWFPRRPSPASVLPLPRPFCSPWFLNLFSPPVAPFSLSHSLPIFLHFAPSLRPPPASLISPPSRHLFQPSWYLFFCHSHLTFAGFFLIRLSTHLLLPSWTIYHQSVIFRGAIFPLFSHHSSFFHLVPLLSHRPATPPHPTLSSRRYLLFPWSPPAALVRSPHVCSHFSPPPSSSSISTD